MGIISYVIKKMYFKKKKKKEAEVEVEKGIATKTNWTVVKNASNGPRL